MLSVLAYNHSLFTKWQAQAGLNIKIKSVQFTSIQMKESCASNHGCVIGTELNWWIAKTNIKWSQFLVEAGTQAGVGRNSPRQHNLLDVVLLRRQAGLDGEHINYSPLEAGRK